MASLSRSLAFITRTVLQAMGTEKTANFDSTGVDISAASGLILVSLRARSTAGTNPTMLLKLQTCETVGGSYTDVAGVTTTAAATSDLEFVVDKAKLMKFIAVNGVISGANASFVIQAEAHYFKKYI